MPPAETRKLVPAGACSRGTISRLRPRRRFPRPRTPGASTMATASGKIGRNRPKSAEAGCIGGRPKSAAPRPPAGRRLRRNGRFDRKCHHRPKRKPGDSRAVKIEIAPVYVDKGMESAHVHMCTLLQQSQPFIGPAKNGVAQRFPMDEDHPRYGPHGPRTVVTFRRGDFSRFSPGTMG